MSTGLGPLDLHSVAVAAVPDPDAIARYLTAAESEVCKGFVHSKRQREWFAGRLAAKKLVQARHQLAGPDTLRRIEIDNAPAGPDRGRPFYRIAGEEGSFPLSISHSGHLAVAALACRTRDLVGVDVESVERRDPSFEDMALSPAERIELAGFSGLTRWRAVTRLWVLKEALLKAIGVGLHVPLPLISVVGNHDGRRGEWSYRISEDTQAMYPALALLATRRVVVSTFETGTLAGAWVVIPHGALA